MAAGADGAASGAWPVAVQVDGRWQVHEDPDVVVVNKAAGMVMHPAAGVQRGALLNGLLHRCGVLGQSGGAGAHNAPGLVHRLDKDTSGAPCCLATALH